MAKILNYKHMKNKESNFSYSKIYLKEVFGINLFLYFIFVLSLELTLSQIVIYLFVVLLLSTLLLYLIGLKRRDAIEKITSVIHQIKSNKNISVDDIVLNPHLEKIENDLKEIHKKNRDDIANMHRLAQARTDFLGNVSHELRTPIFTIQGFLETLLNGAIDDPNVNRRFLKKAINHTHNLNDLLNDLIDISMIESGQMRMQPTYFDIIKFIESLVVELESLADEKGIKIKSKFAGKEIEVFGDKDKLKQVFVNLISNAIKYSESGNIIIITEVINERVKISIKDSGYGISDADLSRIFERFYRVDKARSKDAGGTGLGLAIVKHIVEAHGSKIEVKSKIGKGSTFSFGLRKK
ncbi:MAG: ATP-binding protein [Melioribacteraceae bacterium]|nr:ATP-binding protein [Melioribacteraceae bacterium]